MEIRLQQRTAEWYQHRKQYINASEVGSITGNDKFRTLQQLVHDKIFGTSFTSNKFTEHGKITEPIARTFFENLTKLKFEDAIFVDDIYKTYSASLDGLNRQTNTILEIKCPYINPDGTVSKTWNQFYDNQIIPPNYYAQIQCQLFCSNTKLCYFFVYQSPISYKTLEVKIDQPFIKKMLTDGQTYLHLLSEAKKELSQTKILKTLTRII